LDDAGEKLDIRERHLASLEELREQATTFVAKLAPDTRQMGGCRIGLALRMQ